jgi:hypothetical protein
VRIRRVTIAGTVTIAALLVPVVLEVVGCRARPAEWSELGSGGRRSASNQAIEPEERGPRQVRGIEIVPQSNQEVADLSSDDIVRLMRRIGFSDDLILELGVDMHSALLRSGAARVFNKKTVEAILRVNGRYVYVTSRSRGTFIYDPATGQFGGTAPAQ